MALSEMGGVEWGGVGWGGEGGWARAHVDRVHVKDQARLAGNSRTKYQENLTAAAG